MVYSDMNIEVLECRYAVYSDIKYVYVVYSDMTEGVGGVGVYVLF